MPSTTPGFRCFIRFCFRKKHTPKLSSPSFCFPEWSVTQQRSSGFAFILNPISSQTRQFAVGLWPCLQPSDQLPCQRWKINRMWYYTECVLKKNGRNLVRNSTGIASQRFATPHSGKTQGLFAGSPPVRSGFWEFPRSRNANVTSRYKDILVESPVDSQNYRFFHGFFKQSWNMPDCGWFAVWMFPTICSLFTRKRISWTEKHQILVGS